MKTIDFSIKHPIPILMFVLAIILLGGLCSYLLPADFLPEQRVRKLLVSAEYEGIAAEDIRTLITIPLEDAFASLGGMKNITSVSRDNISLLTIELHWGTDADLAIVEAREIIDSCFETLPSRCKKPTVKAVESVNESLVIAMIPLDNDLQYGRYIAETDIKPRIERIEGVGLVSLSGGEKEQIEIRVSKDALDSRKMTLQTVSDVINSSNFEYPAGNIHQGEKVLAVKTSGLFSDITQIGSTPISFSEGGLVRIADVAEIIQNSEDKDTFYLHDGKECIRIGIKKKNNASPISVSKKIRNELSQLEQLYGTYYSFVIIEDLSEQVKASIVSLILSGIIGCFVTAVVIQFFLKSIRFSLIISSVIPLCVLSSLMSLFIFNKSINIMSLAGIAIGVGMVIDCSAVVIENINRSFQSNQILETVLNKAVSDVAASNIGSTLTTAVVFIPVLFLNGMLGELFSDMALTIISLVLFSCILSLTYIPACVSLLRKKISKESVEPKFFIAAREKYEKVLIAIQNKKWIPFIFLFLCIVIGFISFKTIPFELLPEVKNNNLTVTISFPSGTSVEHMQDEAFSLYQELATIPHIKSIDITGGIEKDDYGELAKPETIIEKIKLLVLTDGNSDCKKDIEEKLIRYPYNYEISNRADLLSDVLDISNDMYVLTTEDQDELLEAAKSYVKTEEDIQPLVFNTEYVFTPDRIANARFSVNAAYSASLAYSLLEGITATSYYKDGREIPIVVKIKPSDIKSISDLQESYVQLEQSTVPLRLLGTIEAQQKEKILYRYNRKDAKLLRNPNKNTNLISVKEKEISEMTGDGFLLIIVVLLLLYLVMGAQFESFLIPLILMFALPPAFSGAFSSLILCGKTLNINSIIALVVLFGTAVNNTILLFESCTESNLVTPETVIASCSKKLKSLLVTNLTTICALIPFAIDPKNQSAQSSLAIAIIGGLSVSLIIVMFVVPSIFSLILPKWRKNHE